MSFNQWFKDNVGTPRKNLSKWMLRLLKDAYTSGYEDAIEKDERYKRGYYAGYRAGRK